MASYDFSGEEVYKAMVNSSVGWYHARTAGSHLILKWKPPENHESEPRTVSIPNADSLPQGTLEGIARDAGANDVDEFAEWIESNL